MALASQQFTPDGATTSQFLVVHDNKATGEPRIGVAIVDDSVRYRPLAWPPNVSPPADLEAICALPGTPGSFLALTSAGRLMHLRYSGDDSLAVLHESSLPGLRRSPKLEAFAVQALADQTVAVWAERGGGEKPGILYWGTYDPVADVVSLGGTANVPVPFPAGKNTRHITDLRLDRDGVMWGTAASDPDDGRAYEAAFYRLGTITMNGDHPGFTAEEPPRRLWTTTHKVEAMELMPGLPGQVYFGADDESAGGWIYVGKRRS
jgi:hypothetical protein